MGALETGNICREDATALVGRLVGDDRPEVAAVVDDRLVKEDCGETATAEAEGLFGPIATAMGSGVLGGESGDVAAALGAMLVITVVPIPACMLASHQSLVVGI
jgi:hypothetical protein